ncbi:GAF domain-containing protein [Fischerella thermalis]|jgi:L-methionine (R)-S-oxide reductase|uniref:GAF domain-containing protein n=1 Tax=Fischerella thermalis TaxID=372787 RepID=UPI0002E7C202|nr:GAF domain-containing protein [Fischerella thermalis]PLZ81313.1 GAF domain-containing protein [Fischerella thermalis WC217]PLZ04538.1 GAF domain-containing protein [Fischerella thermalis WC119]PLZ15464.1 GAF domain-containing protein [Fischerella thermalis WC114]PLZ20652.1 GAF domain-containing protein [Fischerella thermalis WC157]PLZ23138.1 GAF domain-containing protein [Fischerella thermalis WC341]
MLYWKDDAGLPNFYKGWNVFIGEKQNDTAAKLDQSLQKVLEWLKEYMSVDTVTFLIPVTDQQNLDVYASIGLEEEIAKHIRIPIGHGIAGRIAASMKPMILNNLSEVEIVSPILRQKDLKSLVGIPIPLKQGVVGVLHVGTLTPHQFTERDVEQLQLAAHRISTIIDTEVLNCEQSQYNSELGYFNSVSQVLTLNISALKEQVLRLAITSLDWINSAREEARNIIFLYFNTIELRF